MCFVKAVVWSSICLDLKCFRMMIAFVECASVLCKGCSLEFHPVMKVTYFRMVKTCVVCASVLCKLVCQDGACNVVCVCMCVLYNGLMFQDCSTLLCVCVCKCAL